MIGYYTAAYLTAVAALSIRSGLAGGLVGGAVGLALLLAVSLMMDEATLTVADHAARSAVLGAAAAAIAVMIYGLRRRAVRAMATPAGFEHTMAGIFRTTADGQIVECNEAFARTLAFGSAGEVTGRHIGELYVEPQRWQRLLTGLQIARTVMNIEVSLHKPSGGVVWVLMSIAKEDDDPSTHLIGSIVDITARKRADDLLRETETLRSVANLAAAAAHEINNPLNIINGNLRLLARSVDRELAAARVAPALEAVKALEAIVERMTHIIRLERAKQSPTLPEMLDLSKSAASETED